MNSPIIFNNEQLTILNTLYSQQLSKFTKTATGTTSATLNETSGIVTFTAAVSNPTPYTINNSLVEANTKVRTFLVTTDAEDSFAAPVGQYIYDGAIVVSYGDGSLNPAGSIVIGFEIL